MSAIIFSPAKGFVEKAWNGLPYHTIAEDYQKRFGSKVYKIPVSVVDDCPNRRGLKGMEVCSFCDVWGSAAKSESLTMELHHQIEKYREDIRKKYKAEKFLVYFQAYTNTFTKLAALRAHFEKALSFSDIVGFVVGTRPDCLSEGVLQLWEEYHKRSFVAVELGVQSFYDDDLEFLKRGHSGEDSVRALENISRKTSVDLGVHLIFGTPFETDERIRETARRINDLPISNVKLHNLHVLKNTSLEKIHALGQFSPLEFLDYARRVQIFLEHLRPGIAIHRLAAFASRWEELVAPAWTGDKMKTHQGLIDFLRLQESFQSRFYTPRCDEEALSRERLLLKAQARSF